MFSNVVKEKEVDFLPQIGFQIKEKLKELNIFTVEDLQNADLNLLKDEFGAQKGQILRNEAVGIDFLLF